MRSGTLRRMPFIKKSSLPYLLIGAALLSGCGSASKPGTGAPVGAPVGASSTQTAAGSSGQAGALSGEAGSAATGDIPDNQAFLVSTNRAAGYSIKYPEGWTQSGSGRDVTFRDKNNIVHVVIATGAAPTPASVGAQLNALRSANPSLSFRAPRPIRLGSGPAVKAAYTTESAPNQVTGKRVTLVVDRYELAHRGQVATVDLGTPRGVDNVDAYRKMIESFRWL